MYFCKECTSGLKSKLSKPPTLSLSEKIESIKSEVSKELGISVDLMITRTRKREIADARHLCLYIMTKVSHLLTQEGAGYHFGGIAPSSITSSNRKIANLIETDGRFKLEFKNVIDTLTRKGAIKEGD